MTVDGEEEPQVLTLIVEEPEGVPPALFDDEQCNTHSSLISYHISTIISAMGVIRVSSTSCFYPTVLI
jgi:hypothetical protein